jgi:hypothetical protein
MTVGLRSVLLQVKAEPVAVTNAFIVVLWSLDRKRTWLFFFVLLVS